MRSLAHWTWTPSVPPTADSMIIFGQVLMATSSSRIWIRNWIFNRRNRALHTMNWDDRIGRNIHKKIGFHFISEYFSRWAAVIDEKNTGFVLFSDPNQHHVRKYQHRDLRPVRKTNTETVGHRQQMRSTRNHTGQIAKKTYITKLEWNVFIRYRQVHNLVRWINWWKFKTTWFPIHPS